MKTLEEKREQNRKYFKKWYNENKEKQIQKINKRQEEIKRWMTEYKSQLSCEYCGFDNPLALEFHHVKDKKRKNVSYLAAFGASKETILEEIDKCIVLCSNCHQIKHFTDNNCAGS